MTRFKWGNRSLERMHGVDIYLTECATRCLFKSKYDMTIPEHGGVRTTEEQNWLFLAGLSKQDGINDLSYHQSGFALDIAPVAGYDSIDHFFYWARLMYNEWQIMISEGVDGQLEWGGLFRPNGWDKAHWQRVFKI